MYAEILTIGDELCRGEIVDTNRSNFAARLWEAGIDVKWMTSCGDSLVDTQQAMLRACQRADLVICSGGLGPTSDDLTVDAVCELCAVPAVYDDRAMARLKKRLVGAAPERLAAAERQVRVPQHATVFANDEGLAPGFCVHLHGVPVYCFPGVPREVWAIWTHVLPQLEALKQRTAGQQAIAKRTYRVFGLSESHIGAKLEGLVAPEPGASLHFQVLFPEVLVKLVVRASERDVADATLLRLEAQLRERLGKWLYSDGKPLPELVHEGLRTAHVQVAVAESCTGGQLGMLLTAQPGASAYFLGGVVAYANDVKHAQLGVATETLAAHGAVSEACVREMALGAKQRFGADYAIAISGLAGPEGGSPTKPVGTMHLGVALPSSDVVVHSYVLPLARDQARTLAAWWGLWLIAQALWETRAERV